MVHALTITCWCARLWHPGSGILPHIAAHTRCVYIRPVSQISPSTFGRSLWPGSRCDHRAQTPPGCHRQTLAAPAITILVWLAGMGAHKQKTQALQTGYFCSHRSVSFFLIKIFEFLILKKMNSPNGFKHWEDIFKSFFSEKISILRGFQFYWDSLSVSFWFKWLQTILRFFTHKIKHFKLKFQFIVIYLAAWNSSNWLLLFNFMSPCFLFEVL